MILAVVALALLACGRRGDPRAWIGERSALLRCASPGKRPPAPAIAGVPAPAPPSGLLARMLDPIVLDELGYERDSTVCAILEAPSTATIDAANDIEAVVALHRKVGVDALRAGGRCTCEVARGQGTRELIEPCVQTPTIGGCDTSTKAPQVATAVAPLLDALDDVALPWRHWRLVGPTDRPGWFAEHLDTLIANHDGGSTAYRPGDPLGSRVDAIVRDLLAVEHVVAVVRQDSGRATLVAREMDGLLVLDHFRQPLATPTRLPLVERIEAAQVAAMVEQLAPPPSPRKPLVAPDDGTVVELDRTLLEDIDRAAVATGALLDARDGAAPPRPLPSALFDRVAYVAPYGASGEVLRIEHALSVDGLAWAQTLGDGPLLGNLGALGLTDLPLPELPEAEPGRFVLRGTDAERFAVYGVHRFATFAGLMEIAAPGSLAGEQSAWRIDWPGGALPRELAVTGVFDGLRTLLSQRAYRLEVGFDAARTRMVAEARPR